MYVSTPLRLASMSHTYGDQEVFSSGGGGDGGNCMFPRKTQISTCQNARKEKTSLNTRTQLNGIWIPY